MYPREIPLLETEIEIHENGFTDPQMVALVAAIRFMRSSLPMHARKISVSLFEEYPKYLTYFTTTPPDNCKLHAASDQAMQFITDLIEHGIWNIDTFKRQIALLIKTAQLYALEVQDILNISNIYKDYFKNVLKHRSSDTLEEALEIFFNGFSKAYESNDL